VMRLDDAAAVRTAVDELFEPLIARRAA